MTTRQAKDAAVVAQDTARAVTVVPDASTMRAISEALGPGESLSVDMLNRAKWPTGGGSMFELTDGGGVKQIEGVLLLRHPTRVFWQQSFVSTGGGTPPDCSSLDSQTGTGDRGIAGDTPTSKHPCETCPMQEWGSARGDQGEERAGKACRQVTRAYVLREGEVLPVLVPVPPSSFKRAQTYAVMRLNDPNHGYDGCVTRISTEPTKSEGGIAYAVAKFEKVRDLTSEEYTAVRQYRDGILPFLSSLSVVDVEGTDPDAARR